jgi:hypothetical protein
MDAQCTEGATRIIGVAIAFVGCLAASPGGAVAFIYVVFDMLRRGWERCRAFLGKWLPFLRRTVNVSGSANIKLSASGVVTVTRDMPWDEAWDPDHKLRQLHADVLRLHTALASHREEVGKALADRDSALQTIRVDLENLISDVRRQLEELETSALTTDVRALPLVGIGVILSGVPDKIASLPLALWVIVMVVSVGVAFSVIVRSFRPWRALWANAASPSNLTPSH